MIPLLERLAPESQLSSMDAGAVLFRRGDEVRALFAVERGRLRLVRHTVEGVRVTLQTARAGHVLAEASLFADRYHCDAVADIPSTVRRFSRAAILAALDADRALARSLAAALAGQVIDLRTRLELRNIRSARDRVWHHLLAAADGERVVTITRPLKDMAEDLGLTPEALYRTLARLQDDGLVERGVGMIRIMRGHAPDVAEPPR